MRVAAILYQFFIFIILFNYDLKGQGYDVSLFDMLEYRCVGPFRGGRSAAVAGVPSNPNIYYFGATGGGVWKTEDSGLEWTNVSDGYFGGSIGSVAVASSDPNVIYVGGGEVTVRGNVSSGYGMWRSDNAGKTWKFIGLRDSRHIPRIRIHPENPDIVFAAVLGNIYTSSPERGVFKSTDGGETWRKVLFINNDVGAVDLCMDEVNPRILYASTWNVRRNPWKLISGGPGSGIWKSVDSGETWTEITRNPGLPKDTVGIIGISVSPIKPERVWAIVESKTGGVFRSDNGGNTWKLVNEEMELRQRAWYFSRIYADTKDPDIVYVLNVYYHKSNDGGETFKALTSPHVDHHDLWIAPENPDRMIIADDGGAQITFNGGESWSSYHNQPTAQLYRVTTDNFFPFRIYSAQQDNTTIRIAHRSSGSSITGNHWESTAGGESGYLAIDPANQDIVYGGSYGGYLERKDHKTGQSRIITVWPDNPMGYGAESLKYRFQWNYPLFISKHDSSTLYVFSNHVHVSYNEGQNWQIISPDLTRNDLSKLKPSGGPLTGDNTSAEYYCTLFAAAESPRVKDLLWVGSDDGLVHVSKNGGKSWENVTPAGMPEWITINSIEPDPHTDGGCYIACTMYKLGDFKPYLYRTKDFGITWTKINDGINQEHFTRVVRADPIQSGILYAGTESGIYISFDDGEQWQSFQLNLPIVPVTDLTLKNESLIVSTQGRSIWMLDDLTPLYQLEQAKRAEDFFLFKPKAAWRIPGTQVKTTSAGTNHLGGVMTYFLIKTEPDSLVEISIEYLTESDSLIRRFSNKEKRDSLKIKKGGNLHVWDMYYPGADKFDGMVLWSGSLDGPKALPGNYKVRLVTRDGSQTTTFNIMKDPRTDASNSDLQTQFDFIQKVNKKISETHNAIKAIRKVRSQLDQVKPSFIESRQETAFLIELADRIISSLTDIEQNLYQTKNQSKQDPLNFPIRLNNKLAYLNYIVRTGDYPPTDQALAVYTELSRAVDEQLNRLNAILTVDLAAFNDAFRESKVNIIRVEEP